MKRLSSLLLGLFFLVSCLPARLPADSAVGAPVTAGDAERIRMVEAQRTARLFLDNWQSDNYAGMYASLTDLSRESTTAEDFENAYRDTAANLGMQKLEASILSVMASSAGVQVGYRTAIQSALYGSFQRGMVMNLVQEIGKWKIQWDDGMILPELRGGNHLVTDYKIPARGDIYDRSGKAIAAQADAVALGLKPANIPKGKSDDLVVGLSQLTGLTAESLQDLLKKTPAADYVPVGEASIQAFQALGDKFNALAGLAASPYRARYYFDGGVAPQVTGYVLSIPPEKLEEYRRNGYRGDEKVGTFGLEKWGEGYLTGKRGASTYVLNAQGETLTRLAQTDSQAARFIYTTLEKDLQLQAQKALEGFRGAAIVMERDTGRILAMVSSPGFDNNIFEPSNANSADLLGGVLNNENQPLLNRATQGLYPLGSVFKIITMAAALESGEFTPKSSYDCKYEFTDLPGITLYDWTYDLNVNPSGILTLPEGLMLSCNPWFWHIGLDLYNKGKTKTVVEMARSFGLGKPTGIGQALESPGSINDPQKDGDAVQMAIGQGTLLVTPLQVVDFVAAVGNGGTLYRPQLIEKIITADGDAQVAFKPEVNGRLPVKPENLQIIRDAMRAVVNDPRGTAHYYFTGLQVPVYGKTGTAQTGTFMPHAWFAGYTDASRTDRPDIAVVVIAENAGQGSGVAAPIFRRIVEIYFSGKPSRLYPWEIRLYVTATPAPTTTPTVTPTGATSPQSGATSTPVPGETVNPPTTAPGAASTPTPASGP